MKKLSFLLVSIISVVLALGCESGTKSENDSSEFTSNDSLEILSSILTDMKEEIYEYNTIMTNLDAAFINDNPKYVIPYCGLNYTLTIRINSQHKLMIGDELISDFSQVTPRVVEYFSANEESNDLNSPFPLFSRATKQDITDNLNRVKEELSGIEKDKEAAKGMIEFKKKQLEEWETKLRVIKTLGIEELPEVHSKAKVIIESHPKTAKARHDQILDSVIIGYYLLRERHTQKYFQESYVRIFNRQMRHPNSADKDKLEVITCLNQLKVIDHATLKKSVHILPIPYEPTPPPRME